MSWGEGYREGLEEGYERAIRAVVAAQWGEAWALFCAGPWERSTDPDDFNGVWSHACARIASLPTAEQIVDGAA